MGYEVLTDIIDITDKATSLKVKTGKVSKAILRAFPYDSSAIYKWDGTKKSFDLLSIQNKRTAQGNTAIKKYFYKEGLPGVMKERGHAVEAHTKRADSIRVLNVADKGVKGFRSAILFPLMEGKTLYGALYLRAKQRSKASSTNKRILNTISRQLAATIKAELTLKKLKSSHTEHLRLKRGLKRAEKMIALGELSATLAHEIKNPLVNISGFAKRLKKRTEQTSANHRYIDQIINEVGSLEELICGIVSYSEDKALKLKPVRLKELLDNVLEIFYEPLRVADIEVVRRYTNNDVTIYADPERLKIAFDNLISNAIQSMDKLPKEEDRLLCIETSSRANRALINVSDTGCGISPALQQSIFDPFFTTKELGTGLGLPITHNIIKKHGGKIEVYSNTYEGVTFKIKLPCKSNKVEQTTSD